MINYINLLPVPRPMSVQVKTATTLPGAAPLKATTMW